MPAPFAAKAFTFTNPDGTEVHLLGWGNQFTADFETTDGYTVVRDPDTGFYVYAAVSADRETLVPTEARVGASTPAAVGLARHLRPTARAGRPARGAGPRYPAAQPVGGTASGTQSRRDRPHRRRHGGGRTERGDLRAVRACQVPG